MAAAHHERCLADPVLSHSFAHLGHPEHVARLGAYRAEVFGGPAGRSEVAGCYSAMLELHARGQGDDDPGARFFDCFIHAAAGLP
ncbi:MAG: globin family protein [Acidimicrobiales bacterium]